MLCFCEQGISVESYVDLIFYFEGCRLIFFIFSLLHKMLLIYVFIRVNMNACGILHFSYRQIWENNPHLLQWHLNVKPMQHFLTASAT